MVEPRQVNLTSIEAELAQLWKHISESHRDSGAVLRACLLNLVIVVQDSRDADLASEVVATVTHDHPCRAIVLFIDSAIQDDRTEAWVTAHCRLSHGKAEQVCCEQITIRTGNLQSIGVVAPLLVSDLPVFVWWVGPLVEGAPLFEHLRSLADRWIIDSARFPRWDPRPIHELATGGPFALSDINWSRLTPWREVVAQCFDPHPARNELAHLNRVVIASGDPWQAWWMLGWLGSRLGWDPPLVNDSGERLSFEIARSGAPAIHVSFELSPQEPGGMRRVFLASPGAQFDIQRTAPEVLTARRALTDQEPLQRNIMLPPLDCARYMCGELEILGHDRVFEDMLAWVVRAIQ